MLVHDLNCLKEFSQLKLSAPLGFADIPAALVELDNKREELKKDKASQYEKHQAKKAAIAAGKAVEEPEVEAEKKDEVKEAGAVEVGV